VFLVRTRKRILNRYITNQRAGAAFGAGLYFYGNTNAIAETKPLDKPRGLRADDAAAYLGMGKTKFLELVDRGAIPRAVTIDSIKIWDRLDLDAVIDAAKEDTPAENNSFDKILRANR
jgi:predicted DNA-binding transcriptional regulator AlpA